MAKTIIQTIGPLYGEVVNGTVFGRPNGSVYVPSANTVTISLIDARRFIRSRFSYYTLCDSSGSFSLVDPELQLHFVAESQDLQNYIEIEISKSSDFSTLESAKTLNAGIFNGYLADVAQGTLTPIVQDDTYYIRAVLMSGSGVPVATSDTIELKGVEV